MKGLGCFECVVATIIGGALLSTGCSAQSPRESVDAQREVELDSLVCGPKCVMRVLKHYGQQVEINELIHELQWPNVQKGATMAALSKALKRRGVFVCAVVVPMDVPLRWPHPIILHFGKEQLGHFSVLEPDENQTGAVVLWSNERYQETFPSDVCFSKRTEVILVTSNQEITQEALSSILVDRWSVGAFLGMVGVSFLPFLALVPILWGIGREKLFLERKRSS